MNKLNMQSKNIVNDNIEYIKERFPHVCVESDNGYSIDFDLLKQELSEIIVDEKKERYQLSWPGKKEAILTANTPTNKTLRPKLDKSHDLINTRNIYIEGDNLEVLKILQASYLNKIKMIYIDPPYNTGNDFIYNDSFATSETHELLKEGRIDEEGNILTSKDRNNESRGRFHSSWLTMLYSRIKLSRNLLTKDGAIFISIDENEVVNLRKICDEIFGDKNFVASIKILSNPRGRQSSNFFASAGEYVVIYAKNIDQLKIIGDTPNNSQLSTYNKEDERGKYREIGLRKRGTDSKKEDSPSLFFPIYFNPTTEEISLDPQESFIEIIPKLEDGSLGRWRWSKPKIQADIADLICRQVKRNDGYEYDIFQKDYLKEDNKIKHKDFWIEKDINYDRSSEEIRVLFDDKLFDYAKPLYLITKLINTIINPYEDEIILDFFSGSATTAQAVLELNAKDSGNRKFIMVQLPEKCDEESEAYKQGLKNICDIGEERIRRAAEKIKNDTNSKIDYDFRIFKTDTSNMKDVYYKPNQITQEQLKLFETNIKKNRTNEDLLFQVIIDLGLTLDLKIESRKISKNQVYFVESNQLVACFDDELNINMIDKICEVKPQKVVFKDASFKTDKEKINIEERIKKLSKDTEISVI